ncbi:hypothetical protein B0H66DRAFT_350178 [Apodospora peruviana]|uniref:Uncharacterized protein n=1 Tax=Apodospora peruviana TaxID=516989 RepID=A0AAE0HUX8_9PEZI|nr:hypothetical protein B0H66DRAFT_350178 [Apodospora peruviana]
MRDQVRHLVPYIQIESVVDKTRLLLKGSYALITLETLGTAGHGIALMTKAHINITQFLTGFTTASTFTMTSTLLTDLARTGSPPRRPRVVLYVICSRAAPPLPWNRWPMRSVWVGVLGLWGLCSVQGSAGVGGKGVRG